MELTGLSLIVLSIGSTWFELGTGYTSKISVMNKIIILDNELISKEL